MSRGPGRIERIIYEAMRDHPSEVYTVAKLAALAYPDVEPELVWYHGWYHWRQHPVYPKSCRSAILRAAKKAVPHAGWEVFKAEAPGGPPVYFNPYDLRSYARARRLADFGCFHRPDLEEPEDHPIYRESLVPVTGTWWRHVEERKLRRDGKISEADAIRDQLEREVAALMGSVRR